MAIDRQELTARLEQGGSRDFSGLDLSGADLSRLDLRGANLSRADLSAADLRWTILDGADLDAAVLRRADARWAVLRGATLRNTDLVRTNLAWADLTGADMSGADLDGTNLESATLTDAVLPSASRVRPRAARAAAAPAAGTMRLPGGLTVPRPSPSLLAAAVAVALGLLWVWGWMWQRAYLVDGFGLDAGLVPLGQTGHLATGLLRVLPLEVAALLAVPFFLLGLAFVLALAATVPLVLVHASERVLSDVARPAARPFVIGGLFVAITVFFVLVLPPALSFARDSSGQGAPAGGVLKVLYGVFTGGGTWSRLGLLAVLALALYVGWIGWRLLGRWLAAWEMPLSWRLRYPGLDAALVGARRSRVLQRTEPLTPTERRYAGAAVAAVLVLLGFLLTGAGRVHAAQDMCDGGRLPRGQLFLNTAAAGADPRLFCQRLLAQTETEYYVFFPGQTAERVAGRQEGRRALVSAVQRMPNVLWVPASGAHDCPTCDSSEEVKQAARARVLVDPDEVETEGLVLERTGDLVTLDAPEGALATLRIGPNTAVTQDGAASSATALQPGVAVRALGRRAAEAPLLDARLIEIVARPASVAPQPLVVDLADPTAIVISGAGFTPGNQVAIGLGPVGATGPQVPLVPEATVGPDGTFSIAVAYHDGLPVGAAWQVIARDGRTGQFAAGSWLQVQPPATPTPQPTSTPWVVEEETPVPDEGTAAATGEATNTPLPTPQLPSGATGLDCTPDEFEPDWPRGFEKEVFIGFGEGNTTSRNFCGRGPRPRSDIDLAYFYVKAGRWYRVATSDLAPGVDTVLAVGDLSPSTRCEPAGCWNDDRAALTYESEVVFQAVEDGRAMVTVDNRGGAYGDAATYTLSVAEFLPQPTGTPTLAPTATATSTPTASATSLPFIDLYEPNDRCAVAYYPLEIDRVYEATIESRVDEDWFKTVPLPAGRYRLEMQPPERRDYDVTLHAIVNQARNECPPLTNEGRTAGEGRRETIRFVVPPENDGAQFAVRVFSRYRDIYWSEHHPYLLLLVMEEAGSPPPTATATATPTGTPTPTAPPPTPDSALFPRPTVTATMTATPPAAAGARP